MRDDKQFFESILENFFNEKEIKEFSGKILSNKETSSKKRTVGSTEKNKLTWKLMTI